MVTFAPPTIRRFRERIKAIEAGKIKAPPGELATLKQRVSAQPPPSAPPSAPTRVEIEQAIREGKTVLEFPSGEVKIVEPKKARIEKFVEEVVKQEGFNGIVSRVEVAETRQAREVEKFAREKGADVKFLFIRPGEAKVREFAPGVQPGPGARIVVEITSKAPLPKEIPVTPEEVIREERIREQARVVAAREFERAGPLERAALGVRTALAPRGFELIGAPFVGKPIEEVVEEKFAEELALTVKGERIEQAFGRGVIEFLQSPVFEVEAAFLGGAGFAKVAATRVGGRILATKVAKVGLGALGVAFVSTRALEVKQLIDVGQVERGIGKAISGVAIIGAAVAGARLETRFLAGQAAAKKVQIDLAQIEAQTRTTQLREVSVTIGKFKAVTKIGEIRGEVAGAARITEPGKGITRAITLIPKQKVGKITIGPEIILRGGRFVQTVKTTTGLREVFVTETAGLLGERGISVAQTAAIIKQAGITTRFIVGRGFEITPRVFEVTGKLDPLRITSIVRRGISGVTVQKIKVTDVSAQIKPTDTGFRIIKPGLPGPPTPKAKVVVKPPEPVVSIPPKVVVKITGALKDVSKIAGRPVDVATGKALSGLAAVQVPKTVAPTIAALIIPTAAEITRARKRAEPLISARTERLLIERQLIGVTPKVGIITSPKVGDKAIITPAPPIPKEIEITKEREALVTEQKLAPAEVTTPPPTPVIPEPRISRTPLPGLPFIFPGVGPGRIAIIRKKRFRVRLVRKPIPRIPQIKPIKLKGV